MDLPDSDLPNILLIDNHPVSESWIARIFEGHAQVHLATNIAAAADVLQDQRISAILISADTHTINASLGCSWIKDAAETRHYPLLVLTHHHTNERELKFLELGADAVIALPSPAELVRRKVLPWLKHHISQSPWQQAQDTLLAFFQNTYCCQSVSQCITEALAALKRMNLHAALQVAEHPELTCSSFGHVNDFEKALLSHANNLTPDASSGRYAHKNDYVAILIQDMPTYTHPLYTSLTQWVDRLMVALTEKIRELTSVKIEHDIPQTRKGAARLHYYVEKAIQDMELCCEKEINHSLLKVDALKIQITHSPHLQQLNAISSGLAQLKESLMTHCLEIESRYLQFITERRATTRLSFGW
jgi:CheY-like chemotaxis protein